MATLTDDVLSQVEMRVAHTTDEVRNLADQAVDYFTSCVKCGKPIDLNSEFSKCPVGSADVNQLLSSDFCLNILARCNFTAILHVD